MRVDLHNNVDSEYYTETQLKINDVCLDADAGGYILFSREFCNLVENDVCNIGYHFYMAKKHILTQDKIDRHMNNSDELSELSEDGLEYFDDDIDFYLIVCHLMKIRIATVKIVLVHKIYYSEFKKPDDDNKLDIEIFQSENLF
ncbi:uncharacterized protein TNIN_419231 [Trichonephila inaurata madagascariensis]|uniref:Uncharacterized protein n=1 Tax=Trichonephila inaurata madagascariensis TaxID=2747483 RepID=A0A8X7C899_9ARAC|nr:uncharacterized protein TNIN_419231 [Trichonephila inaurata madagascariensis]